jgi:hypothetical protein
VERDVSPLAGNTAVVYSGPKKGIHCSCGCHHGEGGESSEPVTEGLGWLKDMSELRETFSSPGV